MSPWAPCVRSLLHFVHRVTHRGLNIPFSKSPLFIYFTTSLNKVLRTIVFCSEYSVIVCMCMHSITHNFSTNESIKLFCVMLAKLL